MDAEASTTGNRVALAGASSLHTAAHEAAHIVLQRGGVPRRGDVGEAGDQHERYADLVGLSGDHPIGAADLLDRCAGSSKALSVSGESAHREESVATASELHAERPHLLALARRLALRPHDADDLVQDTIVKALPALGTVTTGSHLRAWLLTILRRIHVDRLRRMAREPEAISIEDVRDRLVTEGPVSEEVDASSVDDIRSALRQLPASFREVLVLHELEGRSYREIAHTLDLPLATVGTRLSRARRKLRRVIVARRTNQSD